MSFITDPQIFNRQAHNPSFGALKRLLPNAIADKLTDFYVPINAYFPTPEMYDVFYSNVDSALKYYPDQNETLAAVLSKFVGIDEHCLVLGNGSTELITWTANLFISNTLFTSIPTFGRWTDQPVELGKSVGTYLRREESDFQIDIDDFATQALSSKADVVVLCNPNNPTGAYIPHDQMVELIDRLASVKLIVIDESFIDFVDAPWPTSVQHIAVNKPNVLVIKSLGKCLGLHGIRLGYAAANPIIADKIRRALPLWNINGFAELVLRVLVDHQDEYKNSLKCVINDRKYLQEQLAALPGLTVFPSQTNFVYTKLPREISGASLRNHLAEHYGYIIRECANKQGSDGRFCRISAKPKAVSDNLISAISSYLDAAQRTNEQKLPG